MTLIPPEEIFQHSQQHFHAYRPIVEELYEVDLSGILLKDTEGYLLDKLADRGASEEDDETRQEIIRSKIDGIGGRYWDWMRSAYIFSNKPRSDENLAKTVVHELGHAAHYALMRQDRVVKLSQEPLWSIIKEGFAEYVELETFAPHYALPDIDSFLKWDRLINKRKCNTYTIWNLHRMYESLDDETRIENTHQNLRWLIRCKTRMQKWLFGEHKGYYNPLGHSLFKRAAHEDVDVFDVLRMPPLDLESIIDPADYIKEMTS